MKDRVFRISHKIIISFIVSLMTVTHIASPVSADSFFEYYFIPGETEKASDEPTDEFDEFLNNLPEEIKSNLPEEMLIGNIDEFADGAEEITSFSYVWDKIYKSIINALLPSLKSAAVIFTIILLGTLFRNFSKNISDGRCGKLSESVINTGIVLILISTELISINILEDFKDVICGLMNGMVPLFTVIYGISGNLGTAAAQSGGVMMLVTLCQNLFSGVLMPAVRICLILSAVHSIFPDVGIKPVSTAFRNIATAVMLFSVTLFSFMLGLQNTIAQSADSFGARSIKFLIGNLVPIIGGAVSDSLGTIGGSLSVLKSAGGAAAITIIIILLAPTLVTLLLNRFALFLCKTVSGVLGCTGEESLLEDMGSISSIMLAFAAAISIAFIYSLTLFTGSALAISN